MSPSGNRGPDGPRIGFLPEYDALPGLGNAALPQQTPAPNGKESGHGCGHNLLGAGCTGAAMALKAIMEQEGIPGLVRVYGCAAEETTGAKVFMARDGLFDDLDACLAWHSAPVRGGRPRPHSGRRQHSGGVLRPDGARRGRPLARSQCIGCPGTVLSWAESDAGARRADEARIHYVDRGRRGNPKRGAGLRTAGDVHSRRRPGSR